MEGTNPLTMSEGITKSSLPFGGNLNLENTKLLLEVLKLHSGEWLHQHFTIYLSVATYWSFTAPLYTISLI